MRSDTKCRSQTGAAATFRLSGSTGPVTLALMSIIVLVMAACSVPEDDGELDPVAADTDGHAGDTDDVDTEDGVGTDDDVVDTDDMDTDDDAGDTDRDTVTIALDSDVTTLDRNSNQNFVDIWVTHNIQDDLTTRNYETGEPEPHLATDWEMSDDGLEWRVQLRDDVYFHNGDQMTAEDVKFTWERFMDPEFLNQFSVAYDAVDDIVIHDDFNFSFMLSEPDGLIMHSTPLQFPVVPKDYIEEVGEEEFVAAPVGTGPYQVVEYVPDDRLVLEAFDDYFLGEAEIENVIFRPIPDESARTAALRAGDIDFGAPFSIDQIESIDQESGLDIRTVEGLERVRLILDTREEPLDDLRVRQAINYAMDVESIVEFVLEGYAQQIPGVLVPLEIGYDPDLDPYPYDPDRAAELLVEAGYGDGVDLGEFSVREGYPKGAEVGEAIAQQLDEVGISTDIQLYDRGEFATRSTDDGLGLIQFTGWGGGGQFHGINHYSFVTPCEGGSPVWSGYYCAPELDDLLSEAITATYADPDNAADYFQELENHVYDEAVFGFLYGTSYIFGVDSDLEWEPVPDGAVWMYDASWS